MNVIAATTLRNNLSDAMKEVSQKGDYLLVSKKGKISSALVDIDLFEDLLALGNKKYLNSIKRARKEYREGKVLSHEQVFGEI